MKTTFQEGLDCDLFLRVCRLARHVKVLMRYSLYVFQASDHCVWMVASPSVNGRVALLHASSDLEVFTIWLWFGAACAGLTVYDLYVVNRVPKGQYQ